MSRKGEHDNYIAPEVRRMLEKGVDNIKKCNVDRIYAVDGREGSGKSTVAVQMAHACAKMFGTKFTLDDIVFGASSFKKRVRYFAEKNLRHRVLIFDEGFNGLSSKGSLSKQNRELVRLLMECRQLNLMIFIVLPSFFMLERYVCLHRCHGLIHVFASPKDITRRYYKLYNYSNKKMLYIRGTRFMSYSLPKIKKTYRFYIPFPPTINRKAYDSKKLKAMQEDEGNKDEGQDKYFNKFVIMCELLKRKYKMGYNDQKRYLEKLKHPYGFSHMADFIKKLPVNPKNEANGTGHL